MRKKYFYGAALLASMFFFSCKQNDQIVDQNVTPGPVIPAPSTNELYTYYASPADPTNAQTLDAMWANAEKLTVSAVVPNPAPPKLFQGYWGDTYSVDLRSITDTIGGYIYFLAEWADATKGFNQAPYYFDTTSHRWVKEPSSPQYDTINGTMLKYGYNEDKFGVLWNISTPAFSSQSCYGTCHTYYGNTSNTGALNSGTGNHWTSSYLEKVDQWHLFMMRGSYYKQCSDEFQDDGYSGAGTSTYTASLTNGRHVDQVGGLGSKGSANNAQTLKLSNKTSVSVTVPRWIYAPGYTPIGDKAYYILDQDTLTSNLKIILSVDSMGVLSYGSVAGGSVEGTIDPNTDNGYWPRSNSLPALKAIQSILVAPYVGSRADVGAFMHHDGSKWHVILKRKLKTDDVLKQDVDFSDRTDKQFGIGVFNNANNQHAIVPGLILKFKKATQITN